MTETLTTQYPWSKLPLIASGPMLGAATAELAVEVSRAGGIGFLANSKTLEADLQKAQSSLASLKLPSYPNSLPIGVGWQLWGANLDSAATIVEKYVPAICWLFAPTHQEDLKIWTDTLRTASQGRTKIWIQVGTVSDAQRAIDLANPDVLVLQGADAGGHGLVQSASVISLVPEVVDLLDEKKLSIPVLAAGGIVEGRGVAAALALGASGVVMGTRFLAAEEAGIAAGWKREVIKASDGGVSTSRSTLCDRLKETVGWPATYDGRAISNQGHKDEANGMTDAENVKLYKEDVARGDSAWGNHGRMVTYSGTGVGLVRKLSPASEIVKEVRGTAVDIMARVAGIYQ